MRSLIHPEMSDIPELKRIWCEGFTEDTDGYCDFYFEKYFRPDRCFAVYNGTELESAVHWFDAYYIGYDGNKYGFLFPYAGATLHRYMGHRNLEYMITGCKQYAAEHGKAGMVFATAEELVYLYDRWGYQRTAKLHTYSFHTSPANNGIVWKICPFEEFHKLRSNYLMQLGNCFYWELHTEKYMYEDIFTKGHVLVCEYESCTYFAVCAVEENCLLIRETSFPLKKSDLLAESISRYYFYSGKITIYTNQNDFFCTQDFTAEDIYYGHYGLGKKFAGSERLSSAYINLIAD